MALPPPPKDSPTVRALLRKRLKEINRSSQELAEAAQVPAEYVDDLIGGRRRPPMPGRTDIYERMTTFLKLGRNALAQCARAEDRFLRAQVALVLNAWDGEQIEPTLLRLARDSGHGTVLGVPED